MRFFRALICLSLVGFTFGCTKANPNPNPRFGQTVQLPNGETVVLAKQATKEELDRWNLSIQAGDHACCFSSVGFLIGSQGICILRNGKVVDYKYTAHAL